MLCRCGTGVLSADCVNAVCQQSRATNDNLTRLSDCLLLTRSERNRNASCLSLSLCLSLGSVALLESLFRVFVFTASRVADNHPRRVVAVVSVLEEGEQGHRSRCVNTNLFVFRTKDGRQVKRCRKPQKNVLQLNLARPDPIQFNSIQLNKAMLLNEFAVLNLISNTEKG